MRILAPLLCVPLLLTTVAACGDGGDGDGDGHASHKSVRPSAPPSPPTPPPADPTQAGLPGARAALQIVLRAQAQGDSSACRYIAPGSPFVRGKALRGDCVKGMREFPHFLRPREREALWSVTVEGGRCTHDSDAVIPFSALRYPSGRLTVFQPTFTLRRFSGTWKLVA
jgi:hypothetical protein